MIECIDVLKVWLESVFTSVILAQNGEINDYLLFVPRQESFEYPKIDLRSNKDTVVIPYCDWNNNCSDNLIWIRRDSLNQDQSPILHFCVNKYELHVDVFSKRKHLPSYYVKTRYLHEKESDGSLPVVCVSSIINSDISQQPKGNVHCHSIGYLSTQPTYQLCAIQQTSTSSDMAQSKENELPSRNIRPTGVDQFVFDYVDKSAAHGMNSVLVMMDSSGHLHNMEQITYADGNLNATRLFYPRENKSDGMDNTKNDNTSSTLDKCNNVQSLGTSGSEKEIQRNNIPCSVETMSKLMQKLGAQRNGNKSASKQKESDKIKTAVNEESSARKPKCEVTGRWRQSVNKDDQLKILEEENDTGRTQKENDFSEFEEDIFQHDDDMEDVEVNSTQLKNGEKDQKRKHFNTLSNELSEEQSNKLPLDDKESKRKNQPHSSNRLSHHERGMKENISNTCINGKQKIGITRSDVHVKTRKQQEMMKIESSRFQKVAYAKPVDTGSDEFSSMISTPDEISGNLSGKDVSKSQRHIQVHGSQRRIISDEREISNHTGSASRNIESKHSSKIKTSQKDEPETRKYRTNEEKECGNKLIYKIGKRKGRRTCETKKY